MNKQGKIHLVYAPKHAYGLMSSREFVALWKLGVTITVLDFKESLVNKSERGFIFNWLPIDGVMTSDDLVRKTSIELLRVTSGVFDREYFSILYENSNELNRIEIEKTINKVFRKVEDKKLACPLPVQPTTFSRLDETEYTDWFSEIHKRDERANHYNNIRGEFIGLPLKDIYYRHSFFVRYKVYQSFKLIEARAKVDPYLTALIDKVDFENTHLYHPYNLFENGDTVLYPTNPPLIEVNTRIEGGRYEVAEGHHRLLALSLWNIDPDSEVRVYVFRSMNRESFVPSSSVTDEVLQNTIQNNWVAAKSKIVDIHHQDVELYPRRNIESFCHHTDAQLHTELGHILIGCGILSGQEEAYKFSHKKFIRQVDGQQ